VERVLFIGAGGGHDYVRKARVMDELIPVLASLLESARARHT
jgi:hypothetical protein